MANITPHDYHTDITKHGSYQYVPLKDIVNDMWLNTQEDDSILKNVRRYRILNKVKDAIRKHNKQVFKDILAMEITVPDDLSFVLPHDFVDYVRVSLIVTDPVTGSFRLQPLNINNNIQTAVGYLQDNNWDILFDQDGYILKADSSNAYNKPYKRYEFNTSSYGGYFYNNNYSGRSNNPPLDTTKLSKYGEFQIDERRGEIVFSSDLSDKDIVMEYISDGLSFDTYAEGDISVHKDALSVVKDWAYFSLIEHNRSVPLNEKNRALARYKTSLHEAKIERSGFDLLDITRKLRLSSKTL